MLTVDFRQAEARPRRAAPRSRVGWRSSRVRGDAARRARHRARLLRRRPQGRLRGCRRDDRSGRGRHRPVGRCRQRRRARSPLPHQQLRPRDRVGGARAHLGRRTRARRDRARAPARRPARGDGADPLARAGLVGDQRPATTTHPARTCASTASTSSSRRSSAPAASSADRTTRTRSTRRTGG